MHGIGDVIGYILTAVGGLITAITLFYKAFSSSKQNSLANLLNEKDKEIRQKSEDAEIYRQRCFKAEKEIERLRKEIHHDN